MLGTLETLGDYGLALSQQGVMRVTDASDLYTPAGDPSHIADARKKGGPKVSQAARRKKDRLEGELRLYLDHSRRSIASQKRAHDRGWYAHRLQDRAELRVGDVPHRLIEIRMVE